MSGSISNGGTIGSGSDSIVLNVSEDPAAGSDAQFTVNVDGQQIGSLQTATALKSAGQDQSFTFLGNYGVGPHDVTVTFANNFLLPGTSGDRNVYVDGVTYDGQTISSTTTPIYQSPLFPPNSTVGNIYGNAVFSVNDTTPVPADAPSTPTTTPSAVSVGSGADTLVLNMAEDPYQGDAQFTVSVDGQQVDGLQTTTASVEQGQQQEFDVHGNWGPGDHTVAVTFTNDLIGPFYAGTNLAVDTTDRNLYVMSMKLNGGPAASGTPWEQDSVGTRTFTVTAGSNASAAGSAASTAASGTSDSSATLSATSNTGGGSGNSGTTSDNATITASSLTASQASPGSSDGMTFVASPTDGGTSVADPTTGSGLDSSASTTTDTASSVAFSVGDAAQSLQDLSAPMPIASTHTNSSAGSGGAGQWWMTQQANVDAAALYSHG